MKLERNFTAWDITLLFYLHACKLYTSHINITDEQSYLFMYAPMYSRFFPP